MTNDDDTDIIGSGGYLEDWQRLLRQVPTFSICVSPCSQSHLLEQQSMFWKLRVELFDNYNYPTASDII